MKRNQIREEERKEIRSINFGDLNVDELRKLLEELAKEDKSEGELSNKSINFGNLDAEGLRELLEKISQKGKAEAHSSNRSINFGDLDTENLKNVFSHLSALEEEKVEVEERSINFGDINLEVFSKIFRNKRTQEIMSKRKESLLRSKETIKELLSFNRDYKKRSMFLPERIEVLIAKYREDENMDPNLYEFIEVAGDANRYLTEKKAKFPELKRVYEGISTLGDLVLNRVVKNGIAEKNSPLYGMVHDAKEKAIDGEIMYSVTPFINKNLADAAERIVVAERDGEQTDLSLSEEEYQRLSFLTRVGMLAEIGVNLNRKHTFEFVERYYLTQRAIDKLSANTTETAATYKKAI